MTDDLNNILSDEFESGFIESLPDDNPAPAVTTWKELGDQLGPVTFAWYPWLPNGLLTELVSDPGKGKSGLTLRISGSFTDNLPLPDGTPLQGEGGTVLWCEAEAAQAINYERAKKWGLSLDKIITPFKDGLLDVNLANRGHIQAVTEKALLPGVRLIVVDSLSGSNSLKENDSEIKRITEFLARLARDTGKPILLTHHLRKRGLFDGDIVTLDQVRGHSAIVQAARVIWALDTPDRGSPRLRLSMIKNNLRRLAEPIGVEFTETGVTFGDAPKEPHVETLKEKAADLLLVLLQHGPMKGEDVYLEGEQAGISKRTIGDAKRALKIVSIRKDDGWYWGLPHD